LGTQLLPLHNKPDTPSSALFPQQQQQQQQHNKNKKGKARARSGSLALGNVWDEREELFNVGDDEDDEEEEEDDSEEGSSGDDEGRGQEHTAPTPPVHQDASRDAKPAKSVRWAEGSAR